LKQIILINAKLSQKAEKDCSCVHWVSELIAKHLHSAGPFFS